MLRLHLKYLLSKFNIITISLVSILYIISLLINISSIPSNLDLKSSQEIYFYNVFTMLKLMGVLVVVLLMSLSATSTNDSYQLFLIDCRKLRIKYFLTKMLALLIVSSIIILILMVCYILIGLLGSSWYMITKNDVFFFSYLLLICFMYGLIAYILVKIFNTVLVVFVPCIIVIIEEVYINHKLIRFLTYFCPIIEYEEIVSLSHGTIHVVVIIICYMLLGLVKDYTMDIK